MTLGWILPVVLVLTWKLVDGAVLPLVAPPPQVESKVPSFEETVRRLASVNGPLKTFQAEQDIDVHWLLFQFRLKSTVYAARPAKYKVIIHNPPWILRRFGNVFTQAGRPEDVLTQYVARRIAWKDAGGQRVLYLDLGSQQSGVNPPNLEAFIDPRRWLIERLFLHYEWGDVIAEYQYAVVREFLLPSSIRLRTPTYPIACTMAFRDYQLNVPLSDAVFAGK